MEKDYIISIDMGGTKALGAVINSTGGIIHRVKKSTKDRSKKINYPVLLAGIVLDLIRETGIPETSIKAVCLGIPGSVNPLTGRIGIAPNLNIKNYNIKEELQKHLNYPVLIENDVNLAALGINHFDYHDEAQNILVVFVGTGIGGGLILNKKLYRGSTFYAGEIGHINVMPGGPLCGCGNKGCFEAVASRTAIVRDITKEIKKGSKSVLTKYVKEKTPIKSKALAAAVKGKDRLTVKHINYASDVIGSTLANINNLLNFERIVLGGGVVEALSSYMLPRIKLSFKKNSLKSTGRNLKIVATKLGDDAALYGGIPLVEEFLGIKV
ncbi:MAG TPA: ROK family protein [Ignavibacteriaceae bacterium]|jgi:glucokinase|nr:ROK family protein [Ignavibacteriaceae bacterium]